MKLMSFSSRDRLKVSKVAPFFGVLTSQSSSRRDRPSVFFGGAIGLISCYKGFTCGAGAQGVGRACTESFVASFIAIIVLNFFFAKVAKDWYQAIYGIRTLFGLVLM